MNPEVLAGMIATILDQNESPTNASHCSGQKQENTRIPHILRTLRAANMVIKGGGVVGVYFDWCIREKK